MSFQQRFDETWVANRFRYRKTLKGKNLTLDPDTGYMSPKVPYGFKAVDRAVFIERLRICNNIAEICRSIPIDLQTFYDAIAVDTKFREDVNQAYTIENRALHLNDGLVEMKKEEKTAVINDLMEKAKKYG